MAEFPNTLTPELEHALGFMNFRTGPIADLLRAGGKEIPRKTEAEQAHVLHWFVCLALEHGDAWPDKVDERLKQIVADVKADADASQST
jgi:hypothetical protein